MSDAEGQHPIPPLPVRIRPNLRVGVAVLAARATATASRALGRGGGTALPGLIAERVAPDLLAHLSGQLPGGVAVVTGTNGKTTTSHMMAAILAKAGRRPVRNASGSNLSRGIVGALASRADWLGRLDAGRGYQGNQARQASQGNQGSQASRENQEKGSDGPAVGLFETDEAAFAHVVPAVHPSVVVVANLFRDQLDRYGEVDSVAAIWRDVLAAYELPVCLALNADDPTVAALARPAEAAGSTLFFGVDDVRWGHPGLEHAADAKVCPHCGALLDYPVCFYGHLGHYRCVNGHRRPTPDVRATSVEPRGFAGTDLAVATPAGDLTVRLPLPGLYNVYNALAATAGSLALGLPLSAVRDGLAGFTAAFGRFERVEVGAHSVYLVLAKNPVGMNEALRTLFADGQPKHLLIALNDLDADGKDVSWIWDADFEPVAGHVAGLTVAGRRADDLAVRLKYAGATLPGPVAVLPELGPALDLALAATPPGEALHCVLTYTAMLDLRQVLTARGHLDAYWSDAR